MQNCSSNIIRNFTIDKEYRIFFESWIFGDTSFKAFTAEHYKCNSCNQIYLESMFGCGETCYFVYCSKRSKKGEKGGKGLRHFSMKVCEKVQKKGVTSYNEVADELVAEFSDPRNMMSPQDAVSHPTEFMLRCSFFRELWMY